MADPLVTPLITPTLDTSAYADGDVLFALVPLEPASAPNQPLLLQSVFVIDEADQGAALDLVFFNSSTPSLGTLNAAVSISDANIRYYMGRVSIAAGDYYDMGGNRVADLNNIGRLLKPENNGTGLWVGGVSRGTGTYAVNSLSFRFGFIR